MADNSPGPTVCSPVSFPPNLSAGPQFTSYMALQNPLRDLVSFSRAFHIHPLALSVRGFSSPNPCPSTPSLSPLDTSHGRQNPSTGPPELSWDPHFTSHGPSNPFPGPLDVSWGPPITSQVLPDRTRLNYQHLNSISIVRCYSLA